MNQLQQQLARLEKQLYDQEHHARLKIGHLDKTYLDRQERRRELSAAWLNKTLAEIRRLERENAALRARLGLDEAKAEVESVVLTERGFAEQ